MLTILHGNRDPDEALAVKDGRPAQPIGLTPFKLREEMAPIIQMVARAGASHFWYDKFQIGIPEVSAKSGIVFTEKHIEVLFHLDWWLEPHIYCVTPGRLHSDLVCNDCTRIQPRGVQLMNDRCQFPNCTSHEKWARITNGYVPPSVESIIVRGAEIAHELITSGVMRRLTDRR